MNLVPLPPRKPGVRESRQRLVLSSHFVLERNLRGIPYPSQATDEQRGEVLARVAAAVERLPAPIRPVPAGHDAAEREELWMTVFPQEPEPPESGPGTALWTGEIFGDRYVLGANQGSHVKIWMTTTDSEWDSLAHALELLTARLGDALEWAFRPDVGHLTADPDRLGTGLDIWVLMHLPGLGLRGLLPAMARGLHELGFGLHAARTENPPYRIGGPATEATDGVPGALCYLHNLRSGGNGFSEEMLMGVMNAQTRNVLRHEWTARQKAIEDAPRDVADRVSRAAALMGSAYLLSYREALDALSMLRFGAESGILPVRRPEALDGLHLDFLPCRLRRRFGGTTDVSHRLRAARATVARAALQAAGPPARPRATTAKDKDTP